MTDETTARDVVIKNLDLDDDLIETLTAVADADGPIRVPREHAYHLADLFLVEVGWVRGDNGDNLVSITDEGRQVVEILTGPPRPPLRIDRIESPRARRMPGRAKPHRY